MPPAFSSPSLLGIQKIASHQAAPHRTSQAPRPEGDFCWSLVRECRQNDSRSAEVPDLHHVLPIPPVTQGGGNLSILRLFRLFRLVRIARVGRRRDAGIAQQCSHASPHNAVLFSGACEGRQDACFLVGKILGVWDLNELSENPCCHVRNL